MRSLESTVTAREGDGKDDGVPVPGPVAEAEKERLGYAEAPSDRVGDAVIAPVLVGVTCDCQIRRLC
jgi:hypothetical protein